MKFRRSFRGGPVWGVAAASAVSAAAVAAQILLARDDSSLYLLWNLALALVPWAVAATAAQLQRRGRLGSVPLAGFSLLWLLFFPNAPYMVTDVFHLVEKAALVPPGELYHDPGFWAAVLVWAVAVFSGHLSGLVSLFQMQRLWAIRWGAVAGWLLVAGACGAAGFGVFLGRFVRWNSWSVLTHPAQIVQQVFWFVREGGPLVFAAAFGAFIFVTYLLVRSGFRSDERLE